MIRTFPGGDFAHRQWEEPINEMTVLLYFIKQQEIRSSTSSNFIFSPDGIVTYETHGNDTFCGKQAVNLLGKGLTQEINGDEGSI